MTPTFYEHSNPIHVPSLVDEALDMMQRAIPYRHPTVYEEVRALAHAYQRRERGALAARAADAMLSEFDHMFDELYSFSRRVLPVTPSLEVVRADDASAYEVRASGVDPESVKVNVEDDLLKIEAKSADGHVLVTRTLRLPRRVVDASKISAETTDNMLVLTVPDGALMAAPQPLKASIDVRKSASAKAPTPSTESALNKGDENLASDQSGRASDAEVDGMRVQDVPEEEDEPDI